MIRVLVIQPAESAAGGIMRALTRHPKLQVVRTLDAVTSAPAYLDQCDVVLVSVEFSPEALRQLIRNQSCALPVLVFGVNDAPAQILPYLEAGASGYVRAGSTSNELFAALEATQRGEFAVSPVLGTALVQRMQQLRALALQKSLEVNPVVDMNVQLTKRERAVLALLGQGLSNQAIAQTLTIEPGTVKNHVHSILKKLNLTSRVQAARYYALTIASKTQPFAARDGESQVSN